MELQYLQTFINKTDEYRKPGVTVGYGGNAYNLLDFDPSHIDINKVAHSLSLQARYIGNTYGFYSIAQHSYRVAEFFLLAGDVEKAFQAWGHDISEAFISDVQAPLKKLIQADSDIFSKIEPTIEAIIAQHFGFKFPYDKDVMQVDKNIAIYEMEAMMKNNIFTDYWKPKKAKRMFLEMHETILQFKSYQK